MNFERELKRELLPYILFEKYSNILALEMARPGKQHCAGCIGTLSFPIASCASTVHLWTAAALCLRIVRPTVCA